MAFIETVTEDTAAGPAAQLYAEDVADQGYVANYTRVFALRPEVLAGWAQMAAVAQTRPPHMAKCLAAPSRRAVAVCV